MGELSHQKLRHIPLSDNHLQNRLQQLHNKTAFLRRGLSAQKGMPPDQGKGKEDENRQRAMAAFCFHHFQLCS